MVCPDDLCMTKRTGGRVDGLNGLKMYVEKEKRGHIK